MDFVTLSMFNWGSKERQPHHEQRRVADFPPGTLSISSVFVLVVLAFVITMVSRFSKDPQPGYKEDNVQPVHKREAHIPRRSLRIAAQYSTTSI